MSQLKTLREMTGISYLMCSEALKAADDDIEKAKLILRKQSNQIARKKSARKTNEGIIGAYIHNDGRIGVLVEALCETDFAARTDVFKLFVEEIAMHIAAMEPHVIKRSDISNEQIEEELGIYTNQAKVNEIPEHALKHFIDGKLQAFYKHMCLMEQPFFRDSSMTVHEYTNTCIARIKENIMIKRFERFEVMNE